MNRVPRINVKICGLTRAEDVQAAVEAGANALGFVFTASPRRITIDKAVRLLGYVPKGVLRVGLFLNQDRFEIDQVLRSVHLDVLQFHGSENQPECNVYGIPWLKAVAMESSQSVAQAEADYPDAMGLLLDSHVKDRQGGSGKSFDWSLVRSVTKPVWLAGGLNANNVKQAVHTIRPFAVDVSSGVESAPGIKDAGRMTEFIRAVREVEHELSMT